MARKTAKVSYQFQDVKLVGESYNGYHPHGHCVTFHKEDGTRLKWLTVLSPNRASQVELRVGETATISYSTRGLDDRGEEWVENVRFLKEPSVDQTPNKEEEKQ